ncbi:MAG: efflux RND transporter permease subunit [Planctomycetota bacterium]|nr:MAG: efflux RND transporter permease subunit [Planctomycetota bacterium]
MTTLPRFSVRNPVLVNLFMVTILGGGAYCGLTLIREMFPESRPDQIRISTVYPGATPAEVEKGITLKIEERIKDVEGVDKIISTITEGRSEIMVELRSGFHKIEQAVDDIKAAIDAIPPEDFPEDALETQVTKFEPRFPVIMVSLYGDASDRELKVLGERLRDDLLALPDITHVVLSGTRKYEVGIEVSPDKLVQYGLSFMDVARVVAASNLDLPGGRIRTARADIAVRTLGEKEHAVDLEDLVVKADASGRVVHLRDVARIVDGFEDTDVVSRFNAAPSVALTVYKTPEQDAIRMATLVRALVAGKMGKPLQRSGWDRMLARLRGGDEVEDVYERARHNPYPPGIHVQTHSDLSRFIEGRLDLLTRNGRWGAILVFLSLLVFLHWRVAFWVMMGLVLSVFGSMLFMKLFGQTLNLITMFGLIIVLGMLVDDAIIVAEHVFSKVEQGKDAETAAIQGTEEVTWPVVCAVLTTIVAFVPLMFIKGRIGDWMGVLPAIVCITLSISLFEALTILPCHLAHSLRAVTARPGEHLRPALGQWFRWMRHGRSGRPMIDRLRQRYEWLLRLCVHSRYVTMAALLGVLFAVGGLVAGNHVPFVFLQKIDSETILASVRMQIGAPVSATLKAIEGIEGAAMKLPELRSIYTLSGLRLSDDGTSVSIQSHLGQGFIELVESTARNRTSDEIVQALRRATADLPGVEKLTFRALDGGPGGAAIHLEIRGENLDDLIAVSEEIKSRLRGFTGVFDVVDDFDAGRPEVQIELLESARALGLTTESLATQVRSAFYGFEAQKIQRGKEDIRVMVRYPPEFRRHIYDIESMYVATPAGKLVPFTEVARLKEGTGFSSIRRVNQRRTITVTADVDQNVTNATQIMNELATHFPDIQRRYPGVELEYGGQRLETARAFGSLRHSFFIALALIYVILAALFKNYSQPIIVMAVIPFGMIGVVVGHWAMGYPLTILSMIGTVALTGIVVNDSMVLVTFINRRVREGHPVIESIIEGGKSRLRPILLTSATTVLGIAPLLLEQSFQARFLIPMGIAIASGLIFATVLTLVAIPALYLIQLDLRRVWIRMRDILAGRPERDVPLETLI